VQSIKKLKPVVRNARKENADVNTSNLSIKNSSNVVGKVEWVFVSKIKATHFTFFIIHYVWRTH